jgi:hypothetical protein
MSIRRTRFSKVLLIGAVGLGTVACGTEDDTATPAPTGEVNNQVGKETGKEDAWNHRNNPEGMARFAQQSLNYTLAELPLKGEAANKAWPDTYWPTYQDSTNARWQGKDELSPLEKYDAAFNGWEIEPGFMDLAPYDAGNCEDGFDKDYYEKLGPAARWMSNNKGNKKARDLVYRNGSETPVCDDETKDAVETWWGLCHAWAPAAVNEPEPTYPVTVNGVTFYQADIKGLIQTVYDSSRSIILGGRCNSKDVERDEQNRPIDENCRDTNAGSFHVIMSNFLGIHKMGFLEDRTYDYQVWNQPVQRFEVTQLTEVNLEKALELVGLEGDTYTYNDEAVKFAEVFATLTYITESDAEARALVPELAQYERTDNYVYLLEMDADGEIIGGEWLQGRGGETRWGVSEQPDFLWFSTGPNTDFSRANPHVSYDKVKELIAQSRVAPTPVDGDAQTVFTSEPGAEIPDNSESGVSDMITIGESITAGLVQIQLDVKHTYIGDLKIVLSGGALSEDVVLWDNKGSGADDINEVINLEQLSGVDLKGDYTLTLVDSARIDTGKLMRWAIIAE